MNEYGDTGRDNQNYPNPEDGNGNEEKLEYQGENNISNVSSSTLGLGVDKFVHNPKFMEKENDFKNKVHDFIEKSTAPGTESKINKFVFLMNKVLFISTVLQFYFDRFDVITLFLSMLVFFIEIKLTLPKYLYKIIFIFIFTEIVDIIYFFNIACYIANSNYYAVSAGATMTKPGLLFVLISFVLKLFELIGLWKLALDSRSGVNAVAPHDANENLAEQEQGMQE